MIKSLIFTKVLILSILFFGFAYVEILPGDSIGFAVVAKDGSGNFKTIQDALNSVPANNAKPFVVYLKSGVYNEKISIDKNFVYLIGENKKETKIIYAEQKWIWQCKHLKNDAGPAVVNIKANDIVLMNLTMYNNYGDLHSGEGIPKIKCKNKKLGDLGNKLKPHGHQYVVLSSHSANRLIILNCNIIAAGADALCPWNPDGGMYFIKNCYLEGYNDFVCPRGNCFITDSKFFCKGGSAALWHDGHASPDKKFVITNSTFDGVRGFKLGRYTHDAQFYFITCSFSNNIADLNIYKAKDGVKWGHRVYYFNCHKKGSKYIWLKDNLDSAKDSPKPGDINSEWVFKGKWEPESIVSNSSIIKKYLEIKDKD